MTDYSLHGYLDRQSTEQLRTILQSHISTGVYCEYLDALDVVIDILALRIQEDPCGMQEELQAARQKLLEARSTKCENSPRYSGYAFFRDDLQEIQNDSAKKG